MKSSTQKAELLTRVKTLVDLFNAGKIPTLAQHEVHPELERSSRENYLYFTLPVCINFQRSSPAMWQAAFKTYTDESTRYVFFPELLEKAEPDQVRADLLKYKLALQPNKHVFIWTTIAGSLFRHFNSDPRTMIDRTDYDAGKLIQLLQMTYRQYFPYLSGPKLSNYWPFILSLYTDVQFKNSHEISIIPDTHVLQSSAKLGIASKTASPKEVEVAWKLLLKDSGINPVQVHPVLWNWSRNNFQPNV